MIFAFYYSSCNDEVTESLTVRLEETSESNHSNLLQDSDPSYSIPNCCLISPNDEKPST